MPTKKELIAEYDALYKEIERDMDNISHNYPKPSAYGMDFRTVAQTHPKQVVRMKEILATVNPKR